MKAVNLVRMGLVVGGFTGGGASIDGGLGSGAEDVTVISSATSGEMNARKRINARSLMVPCCIRLGGSADCDQGSRGVRCGFVKPHLKLKKCRHLTQQATLKQVTL